MSKISPQCLLMAVLLCVLVLPVHRSAAEDWQLKRTDRNQIVTTRLMKMLKSKPFSEYALQKLLKLHKARANRAYIIRTYRKTIQRHPGRLGAKVVLARILSRERKWSGALRLFQEVNKKRTGWLPALLGEAKCWRGLKKYDEAGKIYGRLLPSLKGKRRRQVLRLSFQAYLLDGNTAEMKKVLKKIRKGGFSTSAKVAMGKMLLHRQFVEEARPLFRSLFRRVGQKKRVNLLLTLSRAELRAGNKKQALRWSERAYKENVRKKWLRREVFSQLIEVHRSLKKLPQLLKRLKRKWKRSSTYQQVFLLGQLHHELKQFSKAKSMYERALKMKPSAREPRLRLIAWYFQKRQDAKARKHIKMLIRFKNAEPRHYIQLARFLFKSSLRPSLIRWKPSWARIYAPDGTYVRQHAQNSENPKVQANVFCRGKRDNWDDCREKKWRFWEKYEANKQRWQMVKEAKQLLTTCMKRFPKHWDALQQIEELLDRYGFRKESDIACKRLIRATDDETRQLIKVLELLRRRGRDGELMLLFRRVMRPRRIAPKRAELLADFIYRTMNQSSYHQDSGFDSPKSRTRKRRKACKMIKGFLRGVVRSLRSRDLQKRPFMVAKLGAMFLTCRGRSSKTKRYFLQAVKKISPSNEGLERLLEVSMRYRFKMGLKRIFRRLEQRRKMDILLSYLKFQMDDGFFAHTKIVMGLLRTRSKEQAKVASKAIEILCRQRGSCLDVERTLARLVRNRRAPHGPLLRAMHAISTHHLFAKQRIRWVKTLGARYKRKPDALLELIAKNKVFLDPTLPLNIAQKLQSYHRSLLVLAIKKRRKEPKHAKMWDASIAFHLRELAENDSSEQKRFLTGLEQAKRRLPNVYRIVLKQYLQVDRFQQRGVRLLRSWLMKRRALADLQLLDWLPSDAQLVHERWLAKVTKKLRRPKELQWMADFAHKRGYIQNERVALERLLKRKPEQATIKRLAVILDQLPGQQKKADALWFRWLKEHPEQYSLSQLRTFSRSCCQENNERQMAGRLLWMGFRKHGSQSMGKIFQRIVSRLSSYQQRALATRLMRHGKLSKTFHETLAATSYQHGLVKIAIQLYTKLLERGGRKSFYRKRLGLLYDHHHEYDKASKHWASFLGGKSRTARASFFAKEARASLSRKEKWLAMVLWYRSLSAKGQRSSKSDVRRQLSAGKDELAWAHWMRSQGGKARKCLARSSTRHPASVAAPSTLWSIQVSYQGPLFFFRRCDWSLSKHAETHMLPLLLKYLKGNKDVQLALVGAADKSEEPDANFLAKQRAERLRAWLIKRGVNGGRLRVRQNRARLCRGGKGKNIAGKRYLCRSFQRQLAIGPRKITQEQFVSSDSDNDGVVDLLDQCPLRAGAKSSSSEHSERLGCPYRTQPLQIREVFDRFLKLEEKIHFALHSHTILPQSKPLLSQIAALVRIAPQLGKLRVWIASTLYHPDSSFFHRFKMRYRKRYRSKQSVLRQIARKDATRIVEFLLGLKVPKARVDFQLEKTPFRLQRVGLSRPLRVRLRFSR